MKFINYSLTLIILLTLSLASCLKDKDFDDRKNQAIDSKDGGKQNVISVGLTATTVGNHLLVVLPGLNSDTSFDAIPVTLGGQPATENIQVTLKLNPALLGNYNADNGTTHEQPPLGLYSFLNSGDSANGYVVTIPSGSNTGYLRLRLKPTNFLGFDYAIGVQISSVSNGYLIASNLSTGILAFGVKNKWDGVYSLRIKTVGWAAYGISDNLTGDYPLAPDGKGVGLITSGANSTTLHNYFRGDDLQPAFTTGNASSTAFGATNPQFTFDPVTDLIVDVNNTVPDDGRGRAFHLNPSITTSRYDPLTKNIYAAYIMVQNGRPDQEIYDTLTYIGPR